MLSNIEGIIGAVVALLLMAVLLRTVKPAARRSGSRFVMEYGKAMRALGIGMLLLCGVIVYAAYRSSEDQRVIAWMLGGFFTWGGVYMFLEMFFVRIEFDDSFIYAFAPWRGHRRIPWSDIYSFGYSTTNSWHVLKTHRHGTLRVSSFLSGIGSFVSRLDEHKSA